LWKPLTGGFGFLRTKGTDMDGTALTEFPVILVLILLNGVFAAAEIAILTARRGRLQAQADDGSRTAALALQLAGDPNRFLPTVQVGITAVGTLAGVYGGNRLVGPLADALAELPIPFLVERRTALALLIITGAIAYLSLVLGELVPKRLALLKAESFATTVAWPMHILARIAHPFVSLLGASTNAILRLLPGGAVPEAKVSLEDIEYLIETGTREGVVQPAAERMLLETLRLSERRVRDVLRPRMEVDALDINTPADEVLGAAAMSGFSRLPVYEGDLDHIVGFVYLKDIALRLHLWKPLDLKALLRPVPFVPENLTIDRLLERFQQERTQMAVVVDEYGGTEGIVTLEDVLEELMGQIHDEHRRDREQMFVALKDGSWLVDGRVTLYDLKAHLHERIRAEAVPENVVTVSGLILTRLDRVPRIGDSIEWGNLTLQVVDMDGPRIDRLSVRLQDGRN
jgi:putative hemolysin